MNIVIHPRHRRYLIGKVRSGKFKSVSEVVKFALEHLREYERDHARLKRKLRTKNGSRRQITPLSELLEGLTPENAGGEM